jgi:hypothetical protein
MRRRSYLVRAGDLAQENPLSKNAKTALIVGGSLVAIGVAAYVLWPKAAAATSPSSGGAPLPTGALPATIPLVVGMSIHLTLPEVPSTGTHWSISSSTPSIVKVNDVGLSPGTTVGGAALHSFTVTGLAVGNAILTAALIGPTGQPVAGTSALTAQVTVSSAVFGSGLPGPGGNQGHVFPNIGQTLPPQNSGGGVVTTPGGVVFNTGNQSGAQQAQQRASGPMTSTAGGVISRTGQGAGSFKAPYQGVNRTLVWPQNPSGLSTVDHLSSPSDTDQYGYNVAINVGDTLTVAFDDPTAIPKCVPQAPQTTNPQDQRGGGASGSTTLTPGVYCNSWSAISWSVPGSGLQPLGSQPMLAAIGGQGASIILGAVAPGQGVLVFTRVDPNGNTNLTYSFSITVSPSP